MDLKAETKDLRNEIFTARILNERKLQQIYKDLNKRDELLTVFKKQRILLNLHSRILNSSNGNHDANTLDEMQVDQDLILEKKQRIKDLKLKLSEAQQAKIKRQELDEIAIAIQKLNKAKLMQDLEAIEKDISMKQDESLKMDIVIQDSMELKKRVLESLKDYTLAASNLK